MGKSNNKLDSIINIKSVPVQNHIGVSKFMNDDWGTVSFVIPRNQVQTRFIDNELRQNCIYMLFGFDGTVEKVYIGQAKKRNNGESVLARLREHDKSTTEAYKDIWQWAVVCTGKDDTWSLDDLNALEHALYNEIPCEKRLNGNNPNSGGMENAEYTDKLVQIRSLTTAIGFSIFNNKENEEKIQVASTCESNCGKSVENLQSRQARIPEIVTPHKVVSMMCDLLPAEVWNDKTVFLDPACKGGEYLREIYERLMDNELMQSKYPDAFERSNHILGEQLYGIALSEVSRDRTIKKLRGYEHNIRIINEYIGLLKGIKYGNNIQSIINKEFNRDMQIDVVIGNPPYQESNGGGASGVGGITIYDKFINGALGLSDIVCMVTKNNWFQSETLKTTRDAMIDAGIKVIIDYPVLGELFNGVSVAASIFYINKRVNGDTNFTQVMNGKVVKEYTESLTGMTHIPESSFEISIIKKTASEDKFDKHVMSNTPFGIRTNGMINGEGLIDDSDTATETYNIPILYLENDIAYFRYTTADYIRKNSNAVPDYKIICGQALHRNRTVITNIRGLLPYQICTSSFGCIYHSKDKQEAYNVYKYVNTRFVRFLVYCAVDALVAIAASRFRLVPDQDFSAGSSEINWETSIDEIDKQLYKKYKLTQEEVDYIENTIKPAGSM